MGVSPPTDIAPDRLWRSLLGTPRSDGTLDPRPSKRLAYRLPFAPTLAMTVWAVPSLVLASAWDLAECPEVPAVEGRRAMRTIIATTVWAGTAPIFPSQEVVGRLPAEVWEGLSEAALTVLGAICPTYRTSDVRAWHERLKEGAADETNIARARALAECMDLHLAAKGPIWIPRPERYWGIPVGHLLDGHRMAFAAARAATGSTS
jgi:hypothetical protein